MILVPNFERIPDHALDSTLSRLLAREPLGAHSVVDCWNPDCPGCTKWKIWAREVALLNREIEERENNKKKA